MSTFKWVDDDGKEHPTEQFVELQVPEESRKMMARLPDKVPERPFFHVTEISRYCHRVEFPSPYADGMVKSGRIFAADGMETRYRIYNFAVSVGYSAAASGMMATPGVTRSITDDTFIQSMHSYLNRFVAPSGFKFGYHKNHRDWGLYLEKEVLPKLQPDEKKETTR